MKWQELTINTSEEGIEIVLARLDMLGITQVNIIQGHDEVDKILHSVEKYWDYAEEAALNCRPAVQAFIPVLPENEGVEAAIRQSIDELKTIAPELGMDLGSLEIGTRIVDEEDWANNWKAYFKPMQIGEKLLVCPSWEEVPEGSTGAVLRIDPGMAFGSGTHHTTRMCLELLEKLISPDMRVADLGCGSGILSIAASLMGARETYAIDIDPVAAKVAEENAALNGIDMDKYFIRTGDILTDAEFKKDIAGEKFDIVMANIVANIIIAFAPVVPQLIKDGGMFIASGIIDDRLDEVTAALRENGLKIIEVRKGEDWRALLAEKA